MIILMADRFNGDIKLYLTEDGADIKIDGGQPIMEQGLENAALIALFTRPNWCGNIFQSAESQIGSDFEEIADEGNITAEYLERVSDAAARALQDGNFKTTDALTRNTKSSDLIINVEGSPGGSLSVQRQNELWSVQRSRG